MKRVDRDLTWVDHALSLFMILSATYVAGAALNSLPISYFFMAIATATTIFGHILSRVTARTGWARFGGYFYAAIAIIPWFIPRVLNDLLPDQGFPFALIMTGILAWMLVLTQIVTWKDTILCFQVVPCIAIFGLVGAYDYFWTPFLFFSFLIGATSLFFRAHARQMYKVAERSLAPVSAYGMDGEESTDLPSRELWKQAFDSGAWRWMSGAEWALASALVIVLCSVLGAPVIKFSTKGISDAIRLTIPNLPNRRTASAAAANNAQSSGDLQLGQGPSNLSELVMAKVKGNVGDYWKFETYDVRTLRGWSDRYSGSGIGRDVFSHTDIDMLRALLPDGKEVPFEVHSIQSNLPAMTPGEIYTLAISVPFRIAPDGTPRFTTTNAASAYSGTIYSTPTPPPTAKATIPPEYSKADFETPLFIGSRVKQFAKDAVQSAHSDLEKAKLLEQAISKQCDYDLKATPIPNREPVEYFLFESQRGYCDLFASAMATCARSLGLPARVARGYLRRAEVDPDGYYSLRENDSHLWCEIYFKDYGWQVFDPTAGARDISGSQSADGAGLPVWAVAGIFVGSLLATGAISFYGYRLWTMRRPKVVPAPLSEATRAYGQFLRIVESKTKRPKRLGETPAEYLGRIRHIIVDFGPVQEISALFEIAVYGAGTLSEEDVQALRLRVKEWRRTFTVVKQ